MTWAVLDLARLLTGLRRGLPLALVASIVGVSKEAADLALWAKLGRSIPQACELLNQRKENVA